MGAPRIVGVGILVVGLAACGGGGGGDVAATTSPTTTAVGAVEGFDAADQAYATAFDAGSADVAAARKAGNLAGAQAGGRKIRDGLFAYDAALRTLTFPPAATAKATTLITAIADAIAALDAQNTATDLAAYQSADPTTGSAVRELIAARADLRDAVGGAPPANGGSSTTVRATTSTLVTKQQPLDRPYVSSGTVNDASAWLTDLLSVGAANADPAITSSDSLGIVEAWSGAFPLLTTSGRVVGSSVEAPAGGVSGFTVYAKNDKEPGSAGNPLYLAFAVKDSAGRCAAGALSGFPAPTAQRTLTLPAGPCTGAAATTAGDF